MKMAEDMYTEMGSEFPGGYYGDELGDIDHLLNEGVDEIPIYTRISLPELLDKCILPTLQQASVHVVPSVVLCLLCKFISHTVGEGKSSLLHVPHNFIVYL
jgi:hypothetical protein